VRNSRINRLVSIVDQLPRTLSRIEHPGSEDALYRDILLLHRIGAVGIKLGRWDSQNIITRERTVTVEELKSLFPPKKNHTEEYPADDRLERSFYYGEDN
jgi:hypothetical protein